MCLIYGSFSFVRCTHFKEARTIYKWPFWLLPTPYMSICDTSWWTEKPGSGKPLGGVTFYSGGWYTKTMKKYETEIVFFICVAA